MLPTVLVSWGEGFQEPSLNPLGLWLVTRGPPCLLAGSPLLHLQDLPRLGAGGWGLGGKAAKSSLGELRGWKSSLVSSPGKDSVSCGPTVWRPMAKSVERVCGQVQTESRWFS